MSVTFDGIALQNPELFEEGYGIETNQTTLLNGKRTAQISTETALEVSFTCNTDAEHHVTDLRGKIGTFGDLVVDGTTWTGCYIHKFSKRHLGGGNLEYTVEFKQKTT